MMNKEFDERDELILQFGSASIFLAEEEEARTVVSLLDITERKKLEVELKDSEVRYHDLFENSSEFLYTLDLKGNFTDVNKAALDLTGYTKAQLLKMNFQDYTPKRDHRKLFHALSHVYKTGKPLQNLSVEAIIKDKSIKYFETSFNLLKKGERIIGFHGSSKDITERMRTLEDLLLAKEKAQESDRLKSAFLANMSHEIRTPLNGILGFSELLIEPEVNPEDQQRYLEIIQQSGNRLIDIINNVLEIAKMETERFIPKLSKINLNGLTDELFLLFKSTASQKGLDFAIHKGLPDEECILVTDSTRLHQVVNNLIGNALKFTTSGRIDFGYHPKAEMLEFFVRDTGTGIPPEMTEKIFERFRQADSSLTRSYDGAGLGLAISKAIVENFGGRIWCESEPGKGSTFFFTWPNVKFNSNV